MRAVVVGRQCKRNILVDGVAMPRTATTIRPSDQILLWETLWSKPGTSTEALYVQYTL